MSSQKWPDPDSGLGWTGFVVEGRGLGYEGAHIIEILQADVSDSYLAYLRKLGISYLFGGTHSLCFSDICAKLYAHFGIQTMLLQGGGQLDGSFAAEDLIDGLSLLLAPTADCGSAHPALFEAANDLSGPVKPRSFAQKDVQVLESASLLLRYVRERRTKEFKKCFRCLSPET